MTDHETETLAPRGAMILIVSSSALGLGFCGAIFVEREICGVALILSRGKVGSDWVERGGEECMKWESAMRWVMLVMPGCGRRLFSAFTQSHVS